MELIHASQINENDLSSFLTNNHQIDRSSLLRHGYVVQHRNMIIGCFQLDSIEQGVYWLKQLYIIQDEVNKLPVLLELIIVFAKQQERSEEHTSELQSRGHLVCRLLLE